MTLKQKETMKTIKNHLMTLMACCAIALAGCSDDDWQPGTQPTGGVQAYIYADATAMTFLANDEQAFTLHVARANTAEAATVNLTTTGEGFSAPSTVSFAAGEDKKDVTVTFDIPIGSEASVTIALGEDEGYPYGASELTIDVTRDYTWQSQGTWVLTSSFYGGQGTTEVFKAAETNLYKAVEPYEEGYDLLFQVEGSAVTVDAQPIASDYGGYGTLYVQGAGTMEGNRIDVTLLFFVSAGNFGQFAESFSAY